MFYKKLLNKNFSGVANISIRNSFTDKLRGAIIFLYEIKKIKEDCCGSPYVAEASLGRGEKSELQLSTILNAVWSDLGWIFQDFG